MSQFSALREEKTFECFGRSFIPLILMELMIRAIKSKKRDLVAI